METPKRKTYSIEHERSIQLAEVSLKMTKEIGKNVPRQLILDTLVSLLGEKATYDQVMQKIKLGF